MEDKYAAQKRYGQRTKHAAQSKYIRATYDRVTLNIRKDDEEISLDIIKSSANMAGETVNEFILQAIKERVAQLR